LFASCSTCLKDEQGLSDIPRAGGRKTHLAPWHRLSKTSSQRGVLSLHSPESRRSTAGLRSLKMRRFLFLGLSVLAACQAPEAIQDERALHARMRMQTTS